MLTRIFSTVAVIALPLATCATEYQVVDRPRQECWNEQVPVQMARQDYGGAIVGGLAGGLIGNQVGGGNGKVVATALGAMTGAVVGDRMSSQGSSHQMQTVQRCRTVVDHERVPVVRERVEVIQAAPPPPVVVVEQQPVYVAPRPVVVRPRQVVVVEQPAYYMERDEYRYRGWRGHHRHHHDDDDD